MPEIIRLQKPRGLLLAQGPLEAHRHLFAELAQIATRVRPHYEAYLPPYHVLLATARGQGKCFRLLG